MASFFSGGKASDDKDKLARHNAILAAHGHEGYGPSGGASPSSKKKSGGGGKGSGEPAKPKYDPKSKDFADVLKKNNEDGKFGYGYVDANTGIEVPWYIDMINGGGANAAGPEFVSPFADAPMGGGMAGIASQGVTGIANALPFVTPYGSEQTRPYAQAGMVGYDHLGSQSKPQPSGGGSPTVTPNNVPTSTIIPILNANQAAYEQAAFPRLTSSQAAASEDAYTNTSSVPTTRGKAGGPNVTGAVTEVSFKPAGQMTSLFDTRQQSPQPDEQRILQKISDAGQMPYFMQQPPSVQRAQIAALRERGY